LLGSNEERAADALSICLRRVLVALRAEWLVANSSEPSHSSWQIPCRFGSPYSLPGLPELFGANSGTYRSRSVNGTCDCVQQALLEAEAP
jgi:hypothetical protein